MANTDLPVIYAVQDVLSCGDGLPGQGKSHYPRLKGWRCIKPLAWLMARIEESLPVSIDEQIADVCA